MNKTKRLALILVSCVLVIAAVVGVSFAVWSNLEKDHVFTLKAGTLELNISSFDVLNSDQPISFDNPVTMSFKVKVEGEKSTLRFGINSFEYSLVEGEFLPLSSDLFDVELPKTMYGVGGKEEPEIVTCLIKVSLSNAYDKDSFDPVLMGKKFRFNIHVKAETYADPVMYDIIYNNVDGATHNNITQWSVETNYIFKDAEKFGYIFDGWYTDATLTPESRITELTQDDPNIDTLNVYAKWIPIKYAITYDFGSGYQPDGIPEEYTIEDYIDFNLYKPQNDDPTLLFGGYYSDAEFTTPITEITVGTTGAIEIYAKWVQQYNITFIDRLSVENTNPTVFSALDNEIILSDLTADGYVFDGWYIGENRVTTIDTLTESDIELTAIWTAIPYGISWNTNGGTLIDGTPISYDIESPNIDPSAFAPTRDGYTFDGWFTDEECVTSAETIATGSTGEKVFYAKWTAITYSITWNANGGTLSDGTPENYTIETEAIDPSAFAPTREGYTFDGWYADIDLNELATSIVTGSTGEKVFYAKWTTIPYSINWNANGGTLIDGTPESYDIESLNIDPSAFVPTRNGYEFSGWFTDENFETPATTIVTGSTGEKVFYAKWTAISYSITWNANGGTLADGTPENYNIETEAIDPSTFAPTREGYTFDGWFTDENFEATATTIAKGSMGDKTFFAKWLANTYNITWEYSGGVEIENIIKEYTYDKAENLESYVPIRNGYTFDGWYLNETKITEIAVGTIGNITIVAKWIPTPQSITWNANGGTLTGAPDSYTIESPDINPSAFVPTREDHTFEGWFTDENLATQASPIIKGSTGARVFYAKWNIITYTLEWELNGGASMQELPTTYDITYPDNIITLVNMIISKKGYKFLAWYDNAEFTGEPITKVGAGSVGNYKLFAKWELVQYAISYFSNYGDASELPGTYTVEKEIDFSQYTLTPYPENSNYKFAGFYTDESYSQPITMISKGQTGNIDIYVKWIEVYTITWELGDGVMESTPPAEYTAEDADIDLTAYQPTKDGFNFLGWHNGAEIVTSIPTGSTGNIALTAQWEEIVPTP